jgi:E3 ubiquitin-protein ligase HERC2
LGEFGHDAGGLYRESYSVYCSELQSSFLPLLIKSPNNRNTYGTNREAWMPNPAAASSVNLDMFTFLGKLMGIAIRNKEYLSLDLPSIVRPFPHGPPLTRSTHAACHSQRTHQPLCLS